MTQFLRSVSIASPGAARVVRQNGKMFQLAATESASSSRVVDKLALLSFLSGVSTSRTVDKLARLSSSSGASAFRIIGRSASASIAGTWVVRRLVGRSTSYVASALFAVGKLVSSSFATATAQRVVAARRWLYVQRVVQIAIVTMKPYRVRPSSLAMTSTFFARRLTGLSSPLMVAAAQAIVITRRQPYHVTLAQAALYAVLPGLQHPSTSIVASGQTVPLPITIKAHVYPRSVAAFISMSSTRVAAVGKRVVARTSSRTALVRRKIFSLFAASGSVVAVATSVARFRYVVLASIAPQSWSVLLATSKLSALASPLTAVVSRVTFLGRSVAQAGVARLAKIKFGIAATFQAQFLARKLAVARGISASMFTFARSASITSKVATFFVMSSVVVLTSAHAVSRFIVARFASGQMMFAIRSAGHDPVVVSASQISVSRSTGRATSLAIAEVFRLANVVARSLATALSLRAAARLISSHVLTFTSALSAARVVAMVKTVVARAPQVVLTSQFRKVPVLLVATFSVLQTTRITSRVKRYLTEPISLIRVWMSALRFFLLGVKLPAVVITAPNGPYAAGSTPQLTGQIVDGTGLGVPAVDLTSLTLTIVDTVSGVVVNNVSQQNILNTDRGTVDGAGNLTIQLQAADTSMSEVPGSATVERSLIIDFAATSSLVGRQQINFTLWALAGP